MPNVFVFVVPLVFLIVATDIMCAHLLCVFFTFALTTFVKGKKVKKNCKFVSLIFMNFKKSFKRWKSSVGP